jgi:hypothetical protein
VSDYAQEVPDDDSDDIPAVADDNSPENALNPADPEEPALPGDRAVAVDDRGTTVSEQLEGESLDDKLAREESQ